MDEIVGVRKRLYLDGVWEDLVTPPDGIMLGQRFRITRGQDVRVYTITSIQEDRIEMVSEMQNESYDTRWRNVRPF